ncbi:class I SAM-dependent methyltransferase [Candidatus Vampirococcus lugosii]|uniref:S-adenosyl-L-methionine-dependent methyltransferase n=1 Tax=Candidatus Vampirococcus lugosii TaxID=2789015 RepID=A0ABS5QL47_9BACT|nr:class I SAM-dependent methyltransferase [Candidatus Vampirococcus lugosii]MBS8121897.1 S-adenosyl-L-methionine-dependent methyltransferase [Candidatus Vampirococcus lugosii]
MNSKQQIKDFYNSQSEKRNQTRQKYWPEFKIILEKIKKYKKENIKILDLGCGNARILNYLQEELSDFEKIDYTGVDISENLINISKNKYPNYNFYTSDMLDFLQNESQEEYDFVFMIASFQHIPNKSERKLILKYIYKILKYNGKLISINWTMSDWFRKKYNKNIFFSRLKSILSSGYFSMKDIYIPWKNGEKTLYRYYHIFSHMEKINLLKSSGFCIRDIFYINNKGENDTIKNSRNSVFVVQKDIIK